MSMFWPAEDAEPEEPPEATPYRRENKFGEVYAVGYSDVETGAWIQMDADYTEIPEVPRE